MTGAAAVAVRLARTADAPAIAALVGDLLRRFVLAEQPPDAAGILLERFGATGIARDIAEGRRLHVAETGSRLVGVVAVRDDSHLYLLFVDDAFHGRGIARSLWETALAACVEAARPERITVNASAFAVPVYRRLGFVQVAPATLEHGVIATPMEYRLGSAAAASDAPCS